jgi:ABC-type transport system involved in multi-copper enzyme maturation permease subunit
MTAQTTLSGAVAAPVPADRRLAGLGALVRKDTTEWLRGRRAWVVLVVTTAWMTLTAANAWLVSTLAQIVPPSGEFQFTMDPLDNLMAAVGSQVFVMAAILAVASLIVAERQAGTLAWVAATPVSRSAIWVSKWLTATALLVVTAVLVPLAAATGLVIVLYGMPDLAIVAGFVVGMAAVAAFFTAVGLAAATVLPSQVGVVAVGFGTFLVLSLVGGVLPPELGAMLPVAMLTWAAGLAAGMPAPVTTPVATVVIIAALAAFGAWRMRRLEL